MEAIYRIKKETYRHNIPNDKIHERDVVNHEITIHALKPNFLYISFYGFRGRLKFEFAVFPDGRVPEVCLKLNPSFIKRYRMSEYSRQGISRSDW